MYLSVNGGTNDNSGLFAYDLSKETETLLFRGTGYGALTSYNGKLYCVKGNAILEYEPTEDGLTPTSYEIASSSASQGRLSGAQDIARAGDLLVTADTGNSRLSITHMDDGSTELIDLPYAPTRVATDGTIIAASTGNSVYVYERGRNGFALAYTNTTPNVISGIACLYGKCYLLTLGFGYGVAKRDASAPNLCVRDNADRNAPAAICADLYGTLYVVRADGAVFTFTEDNFLDSTFSGSPVSYALPADFTSVRVDFEGNLYCLAAGVLYRNGQAYATVQGQDFVYLENTEPAAASSFALGFEDDEVYLLFGNFIVRTHAGTLGFPTLGTISSEGIYSEITRIHAPEDVTLCDVRQGAVGIAVDLSSLSADGAYFPYASYSRTESAARGVLLAEQGRYRLVALYHDRGYDVRLFREEQCTPALPSSSELRGTAYLLSNSNLYNYPCFSAAKSASPLARGTQVRVLSLFSADPDHTADPDYGYDFAYVEYEGIARETVRGYLPASFLTEIVPEGNPPESYLLGYLKQGQEADFLSEDGSVFKVEGGSRLRLKDNGDGTYTARITGEDGKEYAAVLASSLIDWGESDAWRIALIVGLSVLAVLIVGVYLWLLPDKKKRGR